MLLGLLYMFVCSLDVLSSAFQLVGGMKMSKISRIKYILGSKSHLSE